MKSFRVVYIYIYPLVVNNMKIKLRREIYKLVQRNVQCFRYLSKTENK